MTESIDAKIEALFNAVAFLFAAQIKGLNDRDAAAAMEILTYPFAPRAEPEASGGDTIDRRSRMTDYLEQLADRALQLRADLLVKRRGSK